MNTNNTTSLDSSLIAISGKMGSGKDLVTQIIQMLTFPDTEIVEEFFENPQRTLNDYTGIIEMGSVYKNKKFADKVKLIVSEILGVTVRKLEDREFKNTPLSKQWWYYDINGAKISYNTTDYTPEERVELASFLVKLTPRKLFQLVGTEGGRDIIHPDVWVNATLNSYVVNDEGQLPSWVISDLRFENEYQAIKALGGITIRMVRYKTFSEWLDTYSITIVDMDDYENVGMSDIEFLEFINEYDSELHDDIKDMLNHESEISLDNAEHDYVIHNSGTLVELVENIREILNEAGVEMTTTESILRVK